MKWFKHVAFLIFIIIPVAGTPLLRSGESQVASLQTQRVMPTASDISPQTMLKELRKRGIDPLSSDAPHNLRVAYISYEFQAGQGKNLNSNQEEISKALQQLNEGLSGTSLFSQVRVRTKAPGARVWYALVGSGSAHPFSQLTNDSDDKLPIGIYFVWSERAGKVTSSKLIPFRIIEAQTSVDIEEIPEAMWR